MNNENDPSPSKAAAPWDSGEKRGRKWWLVWLLVCAVAALAAWMFWPKSVAVEVATVSRMPLTVVVSEEGKTRVRERHVVSSPVAGELRRVELKAGDAVEVGKTVLLMIDPADVPLLDPRAREQAEAALAVQQAARLQAQGALDAAESALRLSRMNRDRIRSVKMEAAIARVDRDQAEADVSIKEAQRLSAESALKMIDGQIAEARAVLSRPAIGDAAEPVAVRAPVSGVVLRVMQESRTTVTPGMPILEIGDPGDIEIEAEILSRDAVGIRPGDAVEIEQWGGGEKLRARVRLVEPAAFTKISALGVEEQRVNVMCDLEDAPSGTRLGDRYRVEVRVATWHADEVLAVPAGALFRKGNDWMAFVARGGVAREVRVEIGHSDGLHSEVLGGLSAGDKVLIHPPDSVSDGTRVTSSR